MAQNYIKIFMFISIDISRGLQNKTMQKEPLKEDTDDRGGRDMRKWIEYLINMDKIII